MTFYRPLASVFIGLSVSLMAGTALADSSVSLRILETTDIHSHLVNYDYYRDAASQTVGLAKDATLIKKARDEADNAILIDNGDLIQGNPLGDYMAKRHGLKKRLMSSPLT
ncbi:hypothetical protein [Thalassospira sp. MCCC 1A01428]|uniref:hypothetical protein n=1 Tax=Thalassospira sp. MCCC 1A01428 TaxID=1470575 RepID=UPI000A1D7D14|nr:hypothetical protein [Thalassospira sp. MCCC 1A01428]OSQ46447.1 hypothetical protein THS27_01145 [Thalassospira sp. MCCC 1A01428]